MIRQIFFAGLISLALSLSACGGGGGSGSSAQTSTSTSTPVSVSMQGDSTMYGTAYAANGIDHIQLHPNAPDQAQADLTTRFTVYNDGVPGASLNMFVYGTGLYVQSWRQRVQAVNAHVIVENFGINDAGSTDPESFRAALVEFVNATRADGKIPVIEEPNPICTANSDALDALVAVIDETATSMNVPLIAQYNAIKALPDWQGGMQECVHPIALYPFKGNREAMLISSLTL